MQRLFTADELEYAHRSSDPTQRLAARFAAKEAALKALGAGIGAAPFTDIEVVRGEDGAPELSLHGQATVLAASKGAAKWHLSLTHTSDLAVASTVLEGFSTEGSTEGSTQSRATGGRATEEMGGKR